MNATPNIWNNLSMNFEIEKVQCRQQQLQQQINCDTINYIGAYICHLPFDEQSHTIK